MKFHTKINRNAPPPCKPACGATLRAAPAWVPAVHFALLLIFGSNVEVPLSEHKVSLSDNGVYEAKSRISADPSFDQAKHGSDGLCPHNFDKRRRLRPSE